MAPTTLKYRLSMIVQDITEKSNSNPYLRIIRLAHLNLIQVVKEGIKLNVKKMGMHASWGGLIINSETGKYEATEFEEGTHYEIRGYSKKKGFRATFIGNTDDYACFYCNLHLGEHYLTPEGLDTNHNC